MGVGGPCPPVRNDIVTPRHLFFNVILLNLQKLASNALFPASCHLYSTRLSNDFPFSRCKCRPGYTLDKDGYHCKLDKDCDRVRVDVIFVLDSSNSLAGDDFSEELGVVREFIEFCKNVSRLSVIQFLNDYMRVCVYPQFAISPT